MAREIPLTKGQSAIVDDEDYEWLAQSKWCAMLTHGKWYAVRGAYTNKKHTLILMHREINATPLHLHTDHIDGNGLNNTRSNLRTCTSTGNNRNKTKIKPCSSRFKGVYLHKPSGRWMAYIRAEKILHNLGLFISELDAARAYNEAALKYHGEFARLNDIP